MSSFNSKKNQAKKDFEEVLFIVLEKVTKKGADGCFLVIDFFKEIKIKKQNIKRRFYNE